MRLAGFAYVVPDQDEAIAFFVGGLGWTLATDTRQGGARWVTVACGGVELVLARAATEVQTALVGHQFAGRVGLFVRTDDFERDAARISAAGGTFEEAPREEPYGRVAVWRDPWGTRWDLIEPRWLGGGNG